MGQTETGSLDNLQVVQIVRASEQPGSIPQEKIQELPGVLAQERHYARLTDRVFGRANPTAMTQTNEGNLVRGMVRGRRQKDGLSQKL